MANAFTLEVATPERLLLHEHVLEAQIPAASRQAESGTTVAEICRAVGISEQTFYVWKRKYAGSG